MNPNLRDFLLPYEKINEEVEISSSLLKLSLDVDSVNLGCRDKIHLSVESKDLTESVNDAYSDRCAIKIP